MLTLGITTIDHGLKEFQNLQEISFTGNELAEIANLPETIKFLTLNANRLVEFPIFATSLTNLTHIGLAYNEISSVPVLNLPSLISADFSWNNLYDLEQIVNSLKLTKLKNLTLEGNPICLLGTFEHVISISFPHLQFLDDKRLDHAFYERRNLIECKEIAINCNISCVSFVEPSITGPEESQYVLKGANTHS